MTNKTVCANSKTREAVAAIYCRLSKDDANEGISASIQNQEELLRGYCKEQSWNVAGGFRDDGYSGMNQNRPGFQRMLSEIEQGKFDVVLAKDLSRLGRDYADTGKLIGETFSKKRIRYIAVNGGVFYYSLLNFNIEVALAMFELAESVPSFLRESMDLTRQKREKGTQDNRK